MKYITAICGYADCGKQLFIEILKDQEGVEFIKGLEYFGLRDKELRSKFLNMIRSKSNVFLVKPFIREQQKYLRTNILGIKTRPIFSFRNPAISWLVCQHKMDLIKEGKEYRAIFEIYVNVMLKYFNDYLTYIDKNDHLTFRFEDVVSGNFRLSMLGDYLDIVVKKPKEDLTYRNFNWFDIPKIKQAQDIVSDNDFDIIYDKCAGYMDFFNFKYLSKWEVLNELEEVNARVFERNRET